MTIACEVEYKPVVYEFIRRGLELPSTMNETFKEEIQDMISQSLRKSARK